MDAEQRDQLRGWAESRLGVWSGSSEAAHTVMDVLDALAVAERERDEALAEVERLTAAMRFIQEISTRNVKEWGEADTPFRLGAERMLWRVRSLLADVEDGK